MAKITPTSKKPNNLYTMKSYRAKTNRDVIVPYLALLASLIALAKAYHVF